MVSGSSASKMPESPIDIQQESTSTPKEHYKALGDGKMLIGNVTCTVKKGGVPLKKSEIEDLVKLFNNTLKETTITDKEAWVVGKENVQVFHRDQIGNPTAKATRTLEFKDEDAYKEQFAKFVKTAATTDEVAQPAIAKSGQAAAAASGSPPEAPKSEEAPAEKRTPILDLSGAPDAKTLPPLPSMPPSETKPPNKLPPPPPEDAAFKAEKAAAEKASTTASPTASPGATVVNDNNAPARTQDLTPPLSGDLASEAAKVAAAKASAPPPAAAATTASLGAAGATATSAPARAPVTEKVLTPEDGVVVVKRKDENPNINELNYKAKEIRTTFNTTLEFYKFTSNTLEKYAFSSQDNRFAEEIETLESLVKSFTDVKSLLDSAIKDDGGIDSNKLYEALNSTAFKTYMKHVETYTTNVTAFHAKLDSPAADQTATPLQVMAKGPGLVIPKSPAVDTGKAPALEQKGASLGETYLRPVQYAASLQLLLLDLKKLSANSYEEGSTITDNFDKALEIAAGAASQVNTKQRQAEFSQVNSLLDASLPKDSKQRITAVNNSRITAVGGRLVLKDKTLKPGQRAAIKQPAVKIILSMLDGAIAAGYGGPEMREILDKLNQLPEYHNIISKNPECKKLYDKLKSTFDFGANTRGLLAGIDEEVDEGTAAEAPSVPEFGDATKALLAGLDADAASDSLAIDIEVEEKTAAPGESTPSTPE